MHDNPQAAQDAAFALPDQRVIALSGRDAVAFAQAQFMNDLAALAPGQWQWSGWLTPKGRVLALFALLRLDDGTLWLVLPDADADAFAAALRRFVFRSKVAIEVRGDLYVSGRFGGSPAEGSRFDGDAARGVSLDFGDGLHARTLVVTGAPAAVDAEAAARWRLEDLRHGLPRLAPDQFDRWTPQQLSLDRLQAFSVKKGCYPGQEIVARTHFLGKAKRGLALLACDGAVAVGAEVRAGEMLLGHVMAVATAGNDCHALAVLPLERAVSALRIGDATADEIALSDGLAR